MEFLDISSALDKAESGSGDDFEVPEIYVIKGQLPGNPRYYYCTTNKLAIGIWDAYERRCVRVIETGTILLLSVPYPLSVKISSC